MTASAPTVPPPTVPDAQAIVDRAAIDHYIVARHEKVAPFVDAHYSLIGSLRLHRQAVGLDLLRAPVNVALALPYLGSGLAAAGLDAAGADRLAGRVRRWKDFLDTDGARELTWRLHTEPLELPYDDGRQRSDRDALAAEILADGRLAAALDSFEGALVRSGEDPVFRERLREKINTYMQSRTAAAELANNVVLASAGAALSNS